MEPIVIVRTAEWRDSFWTRDLLTELGDLDQLRETEGFQ